MVSAIIFDCDGVLVDSEIIAHTVELAVLAQAGLSYDTEEFKARFMGMSDEAFHMALDTDAIARLGHPIMASVQPQMQARFLAAMAELQAVPGVRDAVAQLRIAKAVASSSRTDALERKLKQTGLWEHFAPHIYSADHVVHAKPAPDLFLHAASMIGIAPADCVVIEDSVNGVRAAIAAGMTVWGFSGGKHMNDAMSRRLSEAGAHRLVADWSQAMRLFDRLQL